MSSSANSFMLLENRPIRETYNLVKKIFRHVVIDNKSPKTTETKGSKKAQCNEVYDSLSKDEKKILFSNHTPFVFNVLIIAIAERWSGVNIADPFLDTVAMLSGSLLLFIIQNLRLVLKEYNFYKNLSNTSIDFDCLERIMSITLDRMEECETKPSDVDIYLLGHECPLGGENGLGHEGHDGEVEMISNSIPKPNIWFKNISSPYTVERVKNKVNKFADKIKLGDIFVFDDKPQHYQLILENKLNPNNMVHRKFKLSSKVFTNNRNNEILCNMINLIETYDFTVLMNGLIFKRGYISLFHYHELSNGIRRSPVLLYNYTIKDIFRGFRNMYPARFSKCIKYLNSWKVISTEPILYSKRDIIHYSTLISLMYDNLVSNYLDVLKTFGKEEIKDKIRPLIKSLDTHIGNNYKLKYIDSYNCCGTEHFIKYTDDNISRTIITEQDCMDCLKSVVNHNKFLVINLTGRSLSLSIQFDDRDLDLCSGYIHFYNILKDRVDNKESVRITMLPILKYPSLQDIKDDIKKLFIL